MISMLRSCLIHFPPFGFMVKANYFHAIIDLLVLTSWRKFLSLVAVEPAFIYSRAIGYFLSSPMEYLVVGTVPFSFLFARTMSDFHLVAIAFPMNLHGNCVALNELRPVDIAVSGAVAQRNAFVLRCRRHIAH